MFNRVSWSSAEGGIIILPPCSRSSLSFPGSIDTEKHLENQNRILIYLMPKYRLQEFKGVLTLGTWTTCKLIWEFKSNKHFLLDI